MNPSLTDSEGHSKFLNRLFSSGVALAYNANAWKVTQRGAGANMSIDVAAGDGLLVLPNGSYGYWGWSDATKNVTVTAANPTNPRIDTVVAWIDTTVTTTVQANSPGALKFRIFDGTPAGSPSPVSDPTIQSTLGSSTAWVKLATFQVGAGATTVVNANISDARTGISGLVAAAIANGSITASKIDFSTGIWWEEIGRTTLGSGSDTITVSGLPPRKYLRIIFGVFNTGGSITARARFNNDASGNYAGRGSTNGAENFNVASVTSMIWDNGGATASPHFGQVDVINVSAQEKLCVGMVTLRNAAGSANNVDRVEVAGKWANTSNQITRFDLLNLGSGDFAPGSEVIVLAHN